MGPSFNRNRTRDGLIGFNLNRFLAHRPEFSAAARLFFYYLRGLGHFLLHLAENSGQLAQFNYGLGHIISNTNDLGFARAGARSYLTYTVSVCYNDALSQLLWRIAKGDADRLAWFFPCCSCCGCFFLCCRPAHHRAGFSILFLLAVIRPGQYSRHWGVPQMSLEVQIICLAVFRSFYDLFILFGFLFDD